MKTFEEYSNDDLVQIRAKLQFLLNYLQELTKSKPDIEFGNISEQLIIYGMFHSPLWSSKKLSEAQTNVKDILEIVDDLCRVAKAFNADPESKIGSDGSNWTNYEIIIKYKDIDKGLEDDFIKSLKGIDKYNL